MQAAVCSDTNTVHSMMASSSIVLRGGILLVPDGETDAVVAVRKDLLVVADRIACIGEDIDLAKYEALDAVEVDCSAKIVSPGFIDTHHHLWQTQLKGQHADDTVLDYMASGNLSASFFTPADVFWGQLGGALEAMDAGITTVVDHAHMNYSADHCDYGLAATLASGVRSVFCYTPTPLVASWTPRLGLVPAILQPWHLPQLRRFRSLLADHARVALGFAFDGFAFLSAPDTRALFDAVRAQGVRCITSHAFGNPLLGTGPGAVSALEAAGVLGPDVIVAHATGLAPTEASLLAHRGAFVSSTPACESLLGLGPPASVDGGSVGTTLGCDSHSVAGSNMLEQMRLALLMARAQRTQTLVASNKFPRAMSPTVQHVFQRATTHAARAVGMANDIGRLRVGFKADIVTWDCRSPSMACAPAHDPLAALVCHATTRDIDCVIVNGAFRKRQGKLCDVECTAQEPGAQLLASSSLAHLVSDGNLSWSHVLVALEQSRKDIARKIAHADIAGAKGQKAIIEAFGLDESALADVAPAAAT